MCLLLFLYSLARLRSVLCRVWICVSALLRQPGRMRGRWLHVLVSIFFFFYFFASSCVVGCSPLLRLSTHPGQTIELLLKNTNPSNNLDFLMLSCVGRFIYHYIKFWLEIPVLWQQTDSFFKKEKTINTSIIEVLSHYGDLIQECCCFICF